MAGFEGIVTPNQTQDGKSVDGNKISADGKIVPKEGPSLFDSMLAQVTGKGTGASEGEGETLSSNQKQSTLPNQTGVNPNTSNKPVISTQSTGTSLFDKMVSESTAQNQTTNTQNGLVNGTKVSTEIKITDTNTPTSNTDTIKNTQNKILTDGTKTLSAQAVATQNINGIDQEVKKAGNEVAKNSVNNSTVSQIDQKVSTQLNNTNSMNTAQNSLKEQTSMSNEVDIKQAKGQTNSIPNTIEEVTPQKSKVTSSTQTVTKQGIELQKETSNVAPKVQSDAIKQINNESDGIPASSNTKTTNIQTQKQETLSNSQVSKQTTNNIQATLSNEKTNTQNSSSQIQKIDNPKVVTTDTSIASTSLAKKAKDINTQNISENTQSINTKDSVVQNETITKVQAQSNPLESSSLEKTSSQNLKSSSENLSSLTQNQTNTNTNKAKISNDVIPNKNIQPNLVESKTDTKIEEGVKKSLADSLISTATATALADKALSESQNESTKSINSATPKTDVKTTSIVQNTTPVSLSASESTQTSQIGNVDHSTTSQDIKATDQNILDRKVEVKSIDLKTSDKKQELLKNEKDYSLKAATTATLASTNGNVVNTTPTSNQDLASGLASIRDTAKGEITVINDSNLKSTLNENMKKENNLLADKKQQDSNSLLDKMMKEASSLSTSSEEKQQGESLGSKDQFVQKDLPLFATAGYLHDQKKRNDIANMMKKSEGVKQAIEAKNVGDIKNSAQTLGLNVTETEVIDEVTQKEEVRIQNSRDDLLKRMAFDNNVGKKLHNTSNQIRTNENILEKATTLTNTVEEKVVDVAVSAEATQTIENRIIGARQSLRSMMSDVARQMAQNYKPPLTAFRINLNPNGLGNIAVLIKSEQNNGISISLNMSNTNTLETFVDNQSQLRAALTRNFDSTTSFNLDFGMQQDRGSNQNDGSNQNRNQNGSNSAEQSNNIIAEQHTTEEVIAQSNYM